MRLKNKGHGVEVTIVPAAGAGTKKRGQLLAALWDRYVRLRFGGNDEAGGTRTHTSFRTEHFKCPASANSATAPSQHYEGYSSASKILSSGREQVNAASPTGTRHMAPRFNAVRGQPSMERPRTTRASNG